MSQDTIIAPHHEHGAPAAPANRDVALLTLKDLLRRLGPAEVLSHRGIAHQSLEQRKVALRPWAEVHIGPLALQVAHQYPKFTATIRLRILR